VKIDEKSFALPKQKVHNLENNFDDIEKSRLRILAAWNKR
jgi:hypothetical protein